MGHIFNWFRGNRYRPIGALIIALVVIAAIARGSSEPEGLKVNQVDEAIAADSGEAPPPVVDKKAPKPTSTPDLTSTSSNRYGACDATKKFVKERLKAPSTAKFQGCNDVKVTREDKEWALVGWVDAQNGFGAQIRNYYTVFLFLESVRSKDDTWRLKDINIFTP